MPVIVRTAAELSTGDIGKEIEELAVDVKMLQAYARPHEGAEKGGLQGNPEAAKHFLNEIIKRANSCLAKLEPKPQVPGSAL